MDILRGEENDDSKLKVELAFDKGQSGRFSFLRRFSKRRSSATTTTDVPVEQLGIKRVLHLRENDDFQKRKQPESARIIPKPRPSSVITLDLKSSDHSATTAGHFFNSKKQTTDTDRAKRQSSEKGQPKSEIFEFRKTNSLDLKSEDKTDLGKKTAPLAAEPTSTMATTALSAKGGSNATICNQTSNQGDHNNQHQSSSKGHRQQHQFPYQGVPLFPNLTSSDSRRLQQTTATAAAAGFFGFIPPAPGLLPSTNAGWNRKAGNGNIANSRTFTSFDYALGLAGIDPTSASSSNYLFGAAGRNHFVVEFCDDLFVSTREDVNSAAICDVDTVMRSPVRKSSAPTPTPRSTKTGNTGDSISDHNNQLEQQQRSNNEPSSGQVTNAEDSSPKRRPEKVDVVLALRGVTLRDAVQGIVEKRQLNMERVNLFLESSSTPLPWETDTSFLGGHKLYAKAKKDDSPFSKHPLFVSANGHHTSGAVCSTGTYNHQQTISTSLTSQPKAAETGAFSSNPAGGHLFPLSPVFHAGPSTRKDSTTASPGLSKNDRKLSLTQLTKKKTPDRLSLTPDSSFAFNLSSAATLTTNSGDGMPAERLCSSAVPTSVDGGFLFNGSTAGTDIIASSSSTPQHSLNGLVPVDSISSGSFSISGRKERSRSQGRLSQIFPNPFKQDDRSEMLERLEHFQEHGLMTAAGLLHDVNIILCQNALHLEERWQDITRNHENLTRKQQEQQEGLWELVNTELNYIKKLGCIVELQACVGALQNDGFLLDIDTDAIFGNITDICRANLRFWLQCLYPLLQYSRQTGEPLDPTKLEAGFEHIDRLFNPYIPYCLNHFEMLSYIRRKQKDSELFKEFALWVQQRRVLGRLHLTDLLAKPMQRLTKYPLLLKAVLKSTTDGPGRVALSNVIEKAEDFASRVNVELRHKQLYDNLCNIMQCIESYDAIETANDELDRLVKDYSYVDLTAPMMGCRPKLLRVLVLKGDLKLRENCAKMDVICYLFTDMFLVCKAIGKTRDKMRVKIVRPPYHLDRVVVRQLRETAGFAFVYLNEFNIPSAAATFLTPNQDEACKWLEHFHIAKDDYQRMKLADEVTVYKQVARRSFDVSSLSNSMSEQHIHSVGAEEGNSGRRSSAHLMAPSLSGKDGGPHRRISMTAMDDKKKRKPSPAVDVNHRKSNSMDSSVVSSAIAATYRFSPLHGSADGLRDVLPTATVTIPELAKSSSEDDPGVQNLRIPELAADNENGIEQEGMIRRLRANSVEMLKRLSPRLRTPSSGDRSPSPCRPASRGTSPGIFSFRTPTVTPLPESHSTNKLTPFHSANSTMSTSFSTPPATPVPKGPEQERRLSGSHSPLLPQRSASPFRKQKIPSPVFFKSDKQQQMDYCGSPYPATGNDGEGSLSTSPSLSMLARTSANNSLESDDLPAMSSSITTPAPYHPDGRSSNNRRLERRYHTADGIEELKPRRAPHGGILKRFSWSTPAAASAAAAAAGTGGSLNSSKLDAILRKASNTTISSESFGSSSGVSSSSSQLYVSQSENELPAGEAGSNDAVTKNMTSVSGRRFLKWSTAPRIIHQQATDLTDQSIGGSPTSMPDRPYLHHRNVSTIVIGEATATLEAGEEEAPIEETGPPLHSHPDGLSLSAKDSLRRKGIPIIETQAPTPLATPVTTQPTNGHTFSGAAITATRPAGISKEEFLRLLLQGNLESSEV